MSIIKLNHWQDIYDIASGLEKNYWEKRWPNFHPSELACRGTGRLIARESFLDELQKLRDDLGKPMHITSGCRTIEYNHSVGGKSKSFHLCDGDLGRGQVGFLAVDVAAIEGSYRGKLFEVAWRRGWTVGWNAKRGFLHLDQRVMVGWKQTTFDY